MEYVNAFLDILPAFLFSSPSEICQSIYTWLQSPVGSFESALVGVWCIFCGLLLIALYRHHDYEKMHCEFKLFSKKTGFVFGVKVASMSPTARSDEAKVFSTPPDTPIMSNR